MKNKILWILTFTPMVVTLALLPLMNDEIPVHYDGNANVTRWGSKYETLFMPIVIILTGLVWRWLIKTFNRKYENALDDKLKNEYKQNLKVIYISAYITIIVFTIIHIFMLVGSF